MHKIRTPRPGGVPCPTARCTRLFSPQMANARHAIRLTSGCVGAAPAGAQGPGAPQAGCRVALTAPGAGHPGAAEHPAPAPRGMPAITRSRACAAPAGPIHMPEFRKLAGPLEGSVGLLG